MHNIRQFRRAILDDCTCSLTEQNIAINDHSDAMILYIGHYRPIQIQNNTEFLKIAIRFC